MRQEGFDWCRTLLSPDCAGVARPLRVRKDHPTQPVVPTPPSHETTVPATTTGLCEARTSQIVTNGAPPSQVFDDFTFTTAGTIPRLDGRASTAFSSRGPPLPLQTASVLPSRSTLTPPDVRTQQPDSIPDVYRRSGWTGLEKNVSGRLWAQLRMRRWPVYKYQ